VKAPSAVAARSESSPILGDSKFVMCYWNQYAHVITRPMTRVSTKLFAVDKVIRKFRKKIK